MSSGENVNSGESNSGESNSVESNSVESNSVESNSVESNRVESNSEESNSGESNSVESNSVESNSGESNSGESNSGESNSVESSSGESNSVESNSVESNSVESNSEESNSVESNSVESNSVESNSGESNSGESGSSSKETSRPKNDCTTSPATSIQTTWTTHTPITTAERDYSSTPHVGAASSNAALPIGAMIGITIGSLLAVAVVVIVIAIAIKRRHSTNIKNEANYKTEAGERNTQSAFASYPSHGEPAMLQSEPQNNVNVTPTATPFQSSPHSYITISGHENCTTSGSTNYNYATRETDLVNEIERRANNENPYQYATIEDEANADSPSEGTSRDSFVNTSM